MAVNKYCAIIRNPYNGQILNQVYDRSVKNLANNLIENHYFDFLAESDRPKIYQLLTIRTNFNVPNVGLDPRQVVQIVTAREKVEWPPLYTGVKLDISPDEILFAELLAKLFQSDDKGRLSATEITNLINQELGEVHFQVAKVGKHLVKKGINSSIIMGRKGYHLSIIKK